MLSVCRDPEGARGFIEGALLPTVYGFELTNYVIPVRSQYAVVLAYCGEHEKALQEMAQVRTFMVQDPARAQELEDQERLVGRIIRGEVRMPKPANRPTLPPPPRRAGQPRSRVGRNQPCPCGSGLKYKRCCGR